MSWDCCTPTGCERGPGCPAGSIQIDDAYRAILARQWLEPQPEGYTLLNKPDEPVIEPIGAIRLVVIFALCLLAVALIGVAAAWPSLARYFN